MNRKSSFSKATARVWRDFASAALVPVFAAAIAAAPISAVFAWTDITWTGASSSETNYWNDISNWSAPSGYTTYDSLLGFTADSDWVINKAAEIHFAESLYIPIDLRVVGGPVVFEAGDDEYGLSQSNGWGFVGAWTPGELTISRGTYYFSKELHVASCGWVDCNPSGILNVEAGTLRVDSALAIGESQEGRVANGSVNITGGSLVVGYRDGVATNDGTVNLAVSANSTGTLNISGGTLTAATIVEGAGTGTINLNGGTLVATADGTFIGSGVAFNVGDNGGYINPNGHNITIDGDVTGAGSLTIVGNGSVTVNGVVTIGGTLAFTPDAANQAIIAAHSDYTLKLTANQITAAKLAGAGTVEASGGVSAAMDNFYGKVLGRFNATGDSMVLGPRTIAGDLNIQSGIFTLGFYQPSGIYLHLDASDLSNVTLDDNGNVLGFTTPNGARTRWWGPRGSNLMTYSANADYFDTNAVFRMSRGVAYNYVLNVGGVTKDGTLRFGSLFAVYQNYADISGDNEQILFTSANSQDNDKLRFGIYARGFQDRNRWYAWNNHTSQNPDRYRPFSWPIFVDGNNHAPVYVSGKKSVLSFVNWYPGPDSRGIRLGHTVNSFEGAIAEIIGLGWTPSLEDRAAIELYLMQKWNCTDKELFAQIAATANLTMAAGTTLDLNGIDVTVASFNGAGTIKNGLLKTANNVFTQSGRLSIPAVDNATYVASSSNDKLEITGGAGKTVTVRLPANWLDPNSRTYSYIYCDGTVSFEFEGESLEYVNLGDGRYRFGEMQQEEVEFGEYGENTLDDANEEAKDDVEAGLAFPGAYGWGRFAKGARASSSPMIYHVTNLKDSGTGSLREAVSKPNRIVVFDVSGVIKISSRITFASNLYVAGQTAPGEGITVYGNGCSFSGANNIICRYLRWRMGHIGSSGKDCAGIANGANMIFDHCSFSWGLDETFSINPDGKGTYPQNITLQNCIFGQGLMTHSAGGLMQANYITLYRNLYVDNSTRNNKVKGINQYANNIVYNWKNGCYIMGGDSSGSSYCTIQSSLFINGPVSGNANALGGGNSDFHFYGNDNWQDNNQNGVLDPFEVTHNGGGDSVSLSYIEGKIGVVPVLPLYAGSTLLDNNLRKVGASLPYRDQSDCYMIDEVRTVGRSGALITYEDTLAIGAPDTWDWWTGNKRTDADNDGIPDDWETAHGLNPNNYSDALAKTLDGTRLNVEVYINSITADDSQFFLRKPITLRASATTTHSVTLAWRDYTYGEIGFSVEKQETDGSWTQVGIAGPNATTYTVIGLSPGTYYNLRVLAVGNNGGVYAYSDPAAITVNTRQEETGEVDIDNYEANVTMVPEGGTWNTSTKSTWVEGKAYANDDRVLLNTDASATLLVQNGSTAPESVVVNGTGVVTLNRACNLSGTMSLNKGNSGTLVLQKSTVNNQTKTSAATYTGKVVNHEGTIEFDTIANGGSASALGASRSDAQNWVFDGGTYKYTGGSASTDRSATFRKASTLNIANSGTTLTMTGAMEGTGDFILDGAGTLNITDANKFFGSNTRNAIIKGGTLDLSTTGDAGSARNFANRNTINNLVLAGGHVKFASKNEEYQTYDVPIYAEDGTSSEMTLATHSYMKSRLIGNGDIKFNISYVRAYISSNMDDFTGNITANGTASGASFFHNSYWNYPRTRFNLTGTIGMSSKTRHAKCHLGGLSGASGTELRGSDTKSSGSNTTWYIGYANSDEDFAGEINDYNSDKKAKGTTSVVKVGTGIWRLSGASSHSGTTTVDEGALVVNGTLPASSAVYVNDGGTLKGEGTIKGAITVNAGGTIQAGDEVITNGVLILNGKLTLNEGSRLVVPLKRLDNGSITQSRLKFNSGSSLVINDDATLEFDLSEVGSLKAGDTFQVVANYNGRTGTFSSIEPSTPGRGLKWNLDALYDTTQKRVTVVADPSYVPDMDPSNGDVTATVAAVSELDAYNALDVKASSSSGVDNETYKSYFKYAYTDNGNGMFTVEIVGVDDDVVAATVDYALDALENGTVDGQGYICLPVTKGLYYGIAGGTSHGISAPNRGMAGEDTWKVMMPDGNAKFLRIDVAASDTASVSSTDTLVAAISIPAGGTLLTSDVPSVGDDLALKGAILLGNGAKLKLAESQLQGLAEGRSFAIIDNPSDWTLRGEFASIEPTTPGVGLLWDTTKLYDGSMTLAVVADPNYNPLPESVEAGEPVTGLTSDEADEVMSTATVADPSNAAVLTPDDIARYKNLFSLVKSRDGDEWKVSAEISESGTNVVAENVNSVVVPQVAAELADISAKIDGTETSVVVTGIPGLFYSVKSGDSLNGMNEGGREQAGHGGEVKTLKFRSYSGMGFYRILVNIKDK